MTADSQIWENEYGRLEVYPATVYSPTGLYKQYYSVTWNKSATDLDIAFGFNHSLPWGNLYYWNGENYIEVTFEHIIYNNNHFYVLKDISFDYNETKRGYWEYKTNYPNGKWDLYLKRSIDTWQQAFVNDRIIHLDPWFNSDWDYRKLIEINSSMNPSDQTNFPVLLNFTDNDLKNYAQNDGDDICFVDITNTIQYNHEIDVYDNSNGNLVAWVNVTSLNGTAKANTTFYMYYGNADAVNQENITGVWHDKYKLIHHFTGSSALNLDDSTSNSNDVTNEYGNPSYNVVGTIGKAIELDGTNDYLEISDDDSLSFTAGSGDDLPFSVIVIFRDNDTSDYNQLFGKDDDDKEYQCFVRANSENNELTLGLVSPTKGRQRYGNTPVATGNWFIGIVTYDGREGNGAEDGIGIYINNIADTPYTDGGSIPYTGMANTDDPLYIGSRGGGPDRHFEGTIDELFFINEELSSDYRTSFYNNLKSSYNGGYFSINATYEQYEEPCECYLVNRLPVNLTTNVGQCDNLSIQVNSSCGVMDYVNISVYDQLGSLMNYTNYTICNNNTYNHSLCNDNLTELTTYEWYVYSSCNGTQNNTEMFKFTMGLNSTGGGCDCDEIRSIVRSEINRYNAIKESDNIDISIGSHTLLMILGLCLLGFTIFKRDAVICSLTGFTSALMFMTPIILNFSITVFNLIYLCLVFISGGIAVYKVFLGLTETDEQKSPYL